MSRDRESSASAEQRLLLACCTWPTPPPPVLAGPIDWTRFLALGERHRVVGLVHAALPALGVALPADVAEDLAARSTALARSQLLQLVEARRLHGLLEAAGIPALFLKGATLAALAYGRLGIRHSRDIDLLIEPRHAASAATVLETAGYVRTTPPPSMSASQLRTWRRTQKDATFERHQPRIDVELHWRPFANPRLLPLAATERALSVPVGTFALPTLPLDLLFVYLCVHGAYHGWFRIKWLADIAALVAGRAADCGHLMELAAARGVRPAVGQAMVLAHRLLDAPVPSDVIATLEREPRIRLLVAAARRAIEDDASRLTHDTSRSVVVGMSRVLISDRVGYAIGELWGGLTNPYDLLLSGVPDWVASLYPATRIPMVVVRRATETRLMQTLRPDPRARG